MATQQMHGLHNLGYSSVLFTDEELAPIKLEVSKIQASFDDSQKHNKSLAGNIDHEYLLHDSCQTIYQLFQPALGEYNKFLNNWVSDSVSVVGTGSLKRKLVLESAWVNFQKKYEFNPPHNHSGIVSFVIWLNIPFRKEDELKGSPGVESNRHIPGCFNFHYTNILGEITSYPIYADKSLENHALIFPAKLSHSVTPFYSSDEYRVTVAGNFAVDINENL
jgi:hypothetical protein